MNAIEAIHTRNSVGQLTEPGPAGEALDNILMAGVRASDHRRLRPWCFLLIEGTARNKLGELFVQVTKQDKPNLTLEEQQDIAAKTLRAPLIIAVVAHLQADPKVPEIEQLLSTGGAAQLMLLAAHAQGFGGVWRTGDMAYHPRVREGLGLEESDRIVGFLYMGTPKGEKKLTELDPYQFCRRWGKSE